MTSHPVLALTVGDPAGIGPEITVRLLDEGLPDTRLLVIGDPVVLEQAATLLGTTWDVAEVEGPEALGAAQPVGVLAGSARLAEAVTPGELSAAAGRACHAWVLAAAELGLAGRIQGVVTGPIQKQAWALAGVATTGHTEVLQQATGAPRVVMVLAGGGFWTALATIHIPLGHVPAALSYRDLVRTLEAMHTELPRYVGKPRLRIGVCGLNPHAGEGGLYGMEDERIIAPAVRRAREMGIDATGPLPADAVIPQTVHGRYDAVLAMYHDQSLPVVKSLAPRDAVNLTLGLPFVRTSVDHGTAFDIAGRGVATPSSLRAALEVAVRAVGQRAGSVPLEVKPERPPSDLPS